MKWINYHHLIYFKEIANRGSVSKASEFLNIGQPALSSQLKNLEEYLNVKLFDRKNKKLIITEAGKLALEYANKISSLGQELIHTIEEKSISNQKRFYVGALDGIPKQLISNLFNIIQNEQAAFVSFIEGSSEDLISKLISSKIDLFISDYELTGLKGKHIYSKNIVKIPVQAFASPKHKSLMKNFPKSLDGAPCIVPTQHLRLRNDLDHYFYHLKIRPKFVSETQDTALQKIMASYGHGIIFLPHFASRGLIQNKALINLGVLKNVYSEYFINYNQNLKSSAFIKNFQFKEY